MKNLLIIITLFTAFSANSQNYFPLLNEGATWRNAHYEVAQIIPLNYFLSSIDQYFVEGDSTIGGVVYKKVKSSTYGQGNIYNGTTYLMHEENGLVSFTSGVILYNFNLLLGDTFIINYPGVDSLFIVVSIDSIQINNDFRKRINFGGNGRFTSWIEGIGDIGGLFCPIKSVFEQRHNLICYEDSASFWINPIYQGINAGAACYSLSVEETDSKPNINLFPNPADKTIQIEANYILGNTIQYSIIALDGRICKKGYLVNNKIDIGELNSGIYFLMMTENDHNLYSGKFVKE